MEEIKNIGKTIKRYREANGLTQAELGKKVHTSGACISSWEVGRTEPNIGQIALLASVFGVTPQAFIGDLDMSNFRLTVRERDLVMTFRSATAEDQAAVERLLLYSTKLNQLRSVLDDEDKTRKND